MKFLKQGSKIKYKHSNYDSILFFEIKDGKLNSAHSYKNNFEHYTKLRNIFTQYF